MKFSAKEFRAVGAILLVASLGLVGCSQGESNSDGTAEEPEQEFGISDADYTLEALIEAAKAESGITVFDTTGKIVDMAEAFSAKYGLKAVGAKMKAPEQIETAIREAQANNIQSDVFLLPDTPAAVGELLPEDIVVSWFPPDLTDQVDAQFHDPVIITQEPSMWAYNNEVYGDTCPIDSIWDLTTDEWKGKVSLQDPLIKPIYWYIWNQYASLQDDLIADAYEVTFGEKLVTDEPTAMHEWIKRLAQNNPQLTNSDSIVAENIGAPGQDNPSIGFISAAKFRDIEANGYALAPCLGLKPYVGSADTKVAVIAKGTKSPNTAKLFVHFVLTEEGIAPQTDDGKLSTNSTVPVPADEPSGVENYMDQIYVYDSKNAEEDYENLSDWRDFWTINHVK